MRQNRSQSLENPMNKTWLKHYPAGVPAEVDVTQYTSLVALMEESFQRHADRVAYRFLDKAFTYAQVDAWSRAFAAWLQARGVKPGDRVALMMPNVPQ
jgi:long-chain acyl-CoA synthetase